MRPLVLLSCALVLLAVACGCGGTATNAPAPTPNPPTAPAPTPPSSTPTGGGGSSTPPAPPAPAPTPAAAAAIKSTSPSNGATCVQQNPTLTVTFNSGSAPSSVDSNSFQVKGPYGAVAGQVSWDATSRTATWITMPTDIRESQGAPLDMASNYTATVSGFQGGPYSFTFQTGPCGNVYVANTQIVDVGSESTHTYGINNNGVMTGDATDNGGPPYAIIDSNGNITKIQANATGYKINDNNAVAGEYAPQGMQNAFLYQNGQLTNINDPQANSSADQNWAYGINNLGVVVGRYVMNQAGTGQIVGGSGFERMPDGTYSDIQAMPEAINNEGHIVFQSGNSSSIYNGAVYNNIAVPGCSTINAYGLNDNDDVVGWAGGCNSASGSFQPEGSGGFVIRGGNAFQVVVPGCRYLTANGINNQGQVVGSCTNEKGDHGFLATPK